MTGCVKAELCLKRSLIPIQLSVIPHFVVDSQRGKALYFRYWSANLSLQANSSLGTGQHDG
jgi:hypothetical protein